MSTRRTANMYYIITDRVASKRHRNIARALYNLLNLYNIETAKVLIRCHQINWN